MVPAVAPALAAAFGIEFGTSVGDRLNRLDEAVELIRALLPGGPASARGTFYHAKDARNDPPPVQARLPILVGGSGEQRTLRRWPATPTSGTRCGPS